MTTFFSQLSSVGPFFFLSSSSILFPADGKTRVFKTNCLPNENGRTKSVLILQRTSFSDATGPGVTIYQQFHILPSVQTSRPCSNTQNTRRNARLFHFGIQTALY